MSYSTTHLFQISKRYCLIPAMLVMFFIYFPGTYAQISEGGVPYSFLNSLASDAQVVTLPPVDVEALLAEDKLEEAKGIPFRFGYPHPVNYNQNNSGTWTNLPNGDKVWRLRILSPGATTLNLIYDDFWLPEGAKFYIYNLNHSEVIGAFTSRNNNEDGQFATGLVRGESVVLEYFEPAIVSNKGIISVSSIVHGYKNIFGKSDGDDFGSSGACNINVNCPVGVPWANEKRAAAIILSSGGSRLCSGSLVNNVRQDLTPYFLTANHCGGSGSGTWVIMFNYESPSCTNINGPLNYTIQGTTLKASNSASDFYLVQLNQAVPDSYQVHYAGWNATNDPSPTGVGIHHPAGDIKKISFYDVPLQHDQNIYPSVPGSHWKVIWHPDGSGGITEPGSSGSPLYDNMHRIVGQLHGGPSSCSASDKSDSYGKVWMSWDYGTTPATRLKDWLDPDNTGTLTLYGWDPTMTNPDTVAPTKITNLAVTEPGSNSLKLTWSAPLDTSFGGVQFYDIRRSSSPINDTVAFLNATPIPYSGPIGTAGSPQSLVVSNLSFSTTYHFAIRSRDRWNNWSLVSNSTNGTTWAAPVITVTPDSIHHILNSNVIVFDSIRISNTSATSSTLNYSVTLENNTFPGGTLNMQIVPDKNESELLTAGTKDIPSDVQGQSIFGAGGPDAFGYKWIDSDEPNGPVYEWNDIVATGTQVTNWISATSTDPKDDGIAGPFNLGFNFKFYGNVKNSICVSTNGAILFQLLTTNILTNGQIPSTSSPNEVIAPFWDDLDGRTQGTVHYKQDGNKFTIQYTNWQKYNALGSLTFQVVLYSGGKIMIYYKEMNAVLTSATVGIENGTGTVGLQVAYNAAYIHNNLALKFAAEPDWLSGSNLSGTLNMGNAASVVLTYRSEDFPTGNYHMDVMIANNDPVRPLKRVPVTMFVSPVPVELTSISADAVNNSVVLKWETVTETNNSGFGVERKLSGKASWNEVSFVKGNGSTVEKKSYLFNDKNLAIGQYSYRLRQVDLDGTVKYSNAIEVEVSAPDNFSLMQNYPNPFNPETKIKFSLPVKSDVKLTVYNTLGEVVANAFTGSLEAGYHEYSFSAGQFSSGIYFYRLEAGNFIQTKKMTILK